jgi:NADH-ubiquinone oxidoreductase chain 3
MSGMTLFILFVCIIALLFLVINLVFAPHNPYQEKDSAFECGFHSFLQSRSPFNIAFFIYALVYLLLDLEILLIFPYSVSAYTNEVYGLAGALVFILIITAGFVFELGKGALNISSRQTSDLTAKRKNINITYLGKVGLKNESGSAKKYYSTISIPTPSDILAYGEKKL